MAINILSVDYTVAKQNVRDWYFVWEYGWERTFKIEKRTIVSRDVGNLFSQLHWNMLHCSKALIQSIFDSEYPLVAGRRFFFKFDHTKLARNV